MSVQHIVRTDENGIASISFQKDDRGLANQEVVRRYFASEFLKGTADVHFLAVDLSGVQSLDSAALGPLVQKLREVQQHHGRMALAGVNSPALREIFALTRFDKVFDIHPSLREAVASVQARQVASR